MNRAALLLALTALPLACSAPAPAPSNVRKADAALQEERAKLLAELKSRGVIHDTSGDQVYVTAAYGRLPFEDKKIIAGLYFAWYNELPREPTKDDRHAAKTVYVKDFSTHKRLASYDRFDGFQPDD